MRLIQPILIISIFSLVLLYCFRFRTQLLDRFFVVVMSIIGIIMIAFPETSNKVANLFGVGRGADLVAYLGLTGLTFLWLVAYMRFRELHSQITSLTRWLAIREAKTPERSDELGAQK